MEQLSKPTSRAKDLIFKTKYSQSTWGQFKCCIKKQWSSYWRTPDYNLVRFFFALVTALLLGTIFWKVGTKRFVSWNFRYCLVWWNKGMNGASHSYEKKSMFNWMDWNIPQGMWFLNNLLILIPNILTLICFCNCQWHMHFSKFIWINIFLITKRYYKLFWFNKILLCLIFILCIGNFVNYK